MGTFITAYLIIWSAVALYVALLGVRQQRLAAQIESLRSQIQRQEIADQLASKAA